MYLSLLTDGTGYVSGLVSRLVTNANLATMAKDIGLVTHVGLLDHNIDKASSDKTLGTLMEALVGAIHEDSGKDTEAVRTAMHRMGLKLPDMYTIKSKLRQGTRERRKLERIRKFPKERSLRSHDTAERDLHESEDMDQEDPGYRYQTIREEATDDVDFGAMHDARARLDDLGADQESYDKHDTDQDFLEDADPDQTYLEDADQVSLEDHDADLTSLQTPATPQENLRCTTAELGSSSWKELMLATDDSPKDTKATKFDSAIGALALAEDDSPLDFGNLARRMTGKPLLDPSTASEHVVRRVAGHACHDWFPQHCQITLDVALSDRPIRLRK